MRSALRIAAAIPASLAVLLAATGWLYLLRGSSGGTPRIADALPLDELPRHDGASLLLFVLVWSVAALLLGTVARFAGADRLTAATALGLVTGLWCYAATGLSIATVRQIDVQHAFKDAESLRAVLVPALLAAIGGALMGDRRRSLPGSRVALALAIAAVGAFGLLDAIAPHHRRSFVAETAPQLYPATAALLVPLALSLLVLARGILRGKRRAWLLALAVLLASCTLDVLHRFVPGALATGFLVALLVALRGQFTLRGDPSTRPLVLARAALFAGGIYLFGFVALWANRIVADRPFTLPFALRETTLALVGAHLRGSSHLAGDFGEWFPLAVFASGLAAAGALLASYLAPWRYRLRLEAEERERARELVRQFGTDTLSPFVLRQDKSYFFGEGNRAFLAYRVVAGIAIISGDPIGPEEDLPLLLGSFMAYAHARDWRLAVLGASEPRLELYRRLGLHALYHGDEAVVDTPGFSLEGRPIRKVRQSVSRLEHAGYEARILFPEEIGPELRADLEHIAAEWRGAEPDRGFVMALDALFRLDRRAAVFAVGLDPDGRPAGLLHLAVVEAGKALSLSSMPRLRSTPNGFNEWLISALLGWARDNGFERVSLNFAPFAELLAPEAQLDRFGRIQRRGLLALKGHFQLDNLLLFNRKFFPSWQRRFLVYERRRDLPRVSVAALAAEAYLPFTGRKP
jgi:lysyl-tRNA synthetase class 2